MPWQRPVTPPVPFEEEGDGFPVLMVHGRLNDARLWAPVAGFLSQQYRTIRCNLRADGTAYSAADNASRLLALIDWLGVPRVHIVTHGASWSWAAGLAVRASNRIRSVTVVDPVVPRTEQSNSVQESWHLEMLLQWLSVSHGPVVRKPEHATALAAIVAQQTHARIADDTTAVGTPTYGSDLPPLEGIRCPVLALVGQEATAESKALVASVFGQVRKFQLSQVAGGARHCPLEAPRVVADLLGSFLLTCL